MKWDPNDQVRFNVLTITIIPDTATASPLIPATAPPNGKVTGDHAGNKYSPIKNTNIPMAYTINDAANIGIHMVSPLTL